MHVTYIKMAIGRDPHESSVLATATKISSSSHHATRGAITIAQTVAETDRSLEVFCHQDPDRDRRSVARRKRIAHKMRHLVRTDDHVRVLLDRVVCHQPVSTRTQSRHQITSEAIHETSRTNTATVPDSVMDPCNRRSAHPDHTVVDEFDT